MEPVTHILTGACLGRCGLNRRAAYTTAAMAVAAEFPDIDTLWSLRGPVAGFAHHRGITHTFLGIPFEAALITGAFWLLHRLRRNRTTSAPVAWLQLYSFCLLALLSHILLDWTNNYGVRPLLPFDGRWHALSIVFIFDPLIFALLLLALMLPLLFGLIGREVGAPRVPFRNPWWARMALIAIVSYWSVRLFEHDRALKAEMPDFNWVVADLRPDLSKPPRIWASPDPLSVFRWHVVWDLKNAVLLETVDARSGSHTDEESWPKANPSPVLEAAERTPLGRAYLDWSPMPVLTVFRAGGNPSCPGPPLQSQIDAGDFTAVLFRDPRFAGTFPVIGRRNSPPLSGTVLLDSANGVLEQRMDGKRQPNPDSHKHCEIR